MDAGSTWLSTDWGSALWRITDTTAPKSNKNRMEVVPTVPSTCRTALIPRASCCPDVVSEGWCFTACPASLRAPSGLARRSLKVTLCRNVLPRCTGSNNWIADGFSGSPYLDHGYRWWSGLVVFVTPLAAWPPVSPTAKPSSPWSVSVDQGTCRLWTAGQCAPLQSLD